MAGLTHLKDLYSSNGIKFIEKLFSNDVYITEKIDGARFAFKKENGELIYYKRDSKTPMTIVDRTVMKYYESAVEHIESLNLNSIPESLTFGFEYFSNTQPGAIVYDKIPKNGLILTDISSGGSAITNIDTLVSYSKTLKVSPPPIIYNGKMNSTQKQKLIEFLETEWEDLFEKFKTESFTSYIISILNPKLKNNALHIGTSKPIEGIVFSFNDGGTFVNAKVVDPLFTKSARDKFKKTVQKRVSPENKQNNENIKDLLSDITDFVKKRGDFNIKLKNKTKDTRYVELLSELFFQYYQKNKGKFSKIEPSSTDIKELDINYKFIPNKELQSILKSKPKVKSMYKTFLSTFGKKRGRATATIPKSILGDIGTIQNKIKKLSEATYQTKMDRLIEDIISKTSIK